MSWASHNPEKYDEIVRGGIRWMLEDRFPELQNVDAETSDALDYFIEELQNTFYVGKGLALIDKDDWETRYKYKIWDLIEKLSMNRVSDAEGDYFSGLVDHVHDTYSESDMLAAEEKAVGAYESGSDSQQ